MGYINPGLVAPALTALNDLSQAAANATKIQTALNLGGTVRIIGNGIAYISTTLIIPSNTELILDQNMTIRLADNANVNILNNAAVANARTVTDAAVTATSTGITSATANFIAGDVGKTLWVYGADIDGEILKTTVVSVTNSTTAVMSIVAQNTVAITQASIGPRDSNIIVRGGTWDRGNNSAGAANVSGGNIVFRRCDDFTLCDYSLIGGTSGARYGHSLADVTDYTVERLTFNYISDGVHITGPARRGVIRNMRGYTLDDMVSLTPADWTGMNDVFGDIAYHTIEDVRPYLTTNTAVKVLGGKNGSQILNTLSIRVRDVSGYTTNAAEGVGGLVWIGDDSGQASTAGGFLDDIFVENVAGGVPLTGTGKNNQVYINASNAQRIRISGVNVNVPSAVTQHAIYLANLTNIDLLEITDCALQSSSSTSDLIRMDATGNTVASILNVSRCTILPNGGGGRSMIHLLGANSLISTLLMSDCFMQTGYAFIEAPTTGQRVDKASLSNCSAGPIVFLAELAGTTALYLSNINVGVTNSSLNIAHAAAAVTVYAGSNVNLNGKSVVTTAGYSLASKGVGFPVDISKVNSATAGDSAYNTASASYPYVVGPVTYDGTVWRPSQGYMASGTATLVAGTVTVSDAKITANSIIRLFQRTPGGTPGALFVSTITAATSFVIKSTSGSDTSTVYYEVEAY